MLQEVLQKICQDLEIETPPKVDTVLKKTSLLIGDLIVEIKELDIGVEFRAIIKEIENKNREELFAKYLHANLLGQGTGGATIGLSKNEKFLTLSLPLAYELNYTTFKQNLEDFINYLVYWKEAVIEA